MSKRSRTTHIVIHCSATRPSMDIGAEQIREWHIAKGWADIGYHAVIRRDGRIEFGRHFDDVGAHVEGFNGTTVGVCMVGGLRMDGTGPVEDRSMFTPAQWASLHEIVQTLMHAYPSALIVGHRDFSPDLDHDGKIEPREFLKTCPGFDVNAWAHGFPSP